MAKELKHVQFQNLEIGQEVIIIDNGQSESTRVAEVGVGPNNLFCNVVNADGLKQIYFQNIYYLP